MSGAHFAEARLRAFALGELDEREAVEIALHIDGCGRCAARAAVLEPLAAAFASVDDPELPAGLVADVLAAAPTRRGLGPEPAIAAGLLALAFLLLVAGHAPTGLLVDLARTLEALGTTARVLLELLAAFAPWFTVLATVLLAACIWLARTLELQRRSA